MIKMCEFCGVNPVPKGMVKTCSAECSDAFTKRRKREYILSDRQKWRDYNRRYYKENRERCLASSERCRQRERLKIENQPSKRLDILVRSCRLSAKRKGLTFEIDRNTIEKAIILQGGVCALTKMPFDWKFGGEHRANPHAPSVDRMDSRAGYAPDNIQVVCYIVNLAKNEYPVSLFGEMCRARMKVLTNDQTKT